MNKQDLTPEAIKKKYKDIGIQKAFDYGEKYPWVNNAMLEFGEQCFKAGIKAGIAIEFVSDGRVNGLKFESFQEYLKTLKDE